MGERDDAVLCCCEYVNSEGERSHLLAVCCNCEELDAACDRVCRWQGVEPGSCDRILATAADRLRVPWPGGAKKVAPDLVLGVAVVPAVLVLGSVSWVMAGVAYTALLPCALFTVHRFIRGGDAGLDTPTYTTDATRRPKKRPRSKFYLLWLCWSVVALLAVYYTQVITYLKISPWENLVLLLLTWLAATCMYLVRATASPGFESPGGKDNAYDNVIESGAWRICGECELQVPRQASHCRTCDKCFHLRDHHCLWLDTCINHVNERWFVAGLACGLAALAYGCHLTLTTVCHPAILDLYVMEVLVPRKCPDAYATTQSGLATSGACYSLVLAVLVFLTLLQQVICIMTGVKVREYRHRRQLPSQAQAWSLSKACQNCFKFWWRGSSDAS